MDITDLNRGEIYIARNLINGKGYVGKGEKYISQNKQKWGYKSRWARHRQEALNENNIDKQLRNTLLNQAIREFGFDNFTVDKICDCELKDMDDMEMKYIESYNTKEPIGYNMTYGGSSGRHSDISNIKKQVPRNISLEDRLSIQDENIANGIQGRKYDHDRELPKYLSCSRKPCGKVIGYKLTFPMGIETRELIKKTFTNTAHPEEALKEAKLYLEDLHVKKNILLEEFKTNGKAF